jgi:predicted ATPase
MSIRGCGRGREGAYRPDRSTRPRSYERRALLPGELFRLKGELLLRQAETNQAEALFREAIHVASIQQAKSLELRASTSLARLLCEQAKRREAHDLPAPIYDCFTEGFDTPDLKEAKALLPLRAA